MKDCSHHYDKAVTPFELVERFILSPEGQGWYQRLLESLQANEPEKGCFKGEEF